MPDELQIILDKSVVFGLSHSEIDSLDRYFFQIVTPILKNEILADLTKQDAEPDILKEIGRHSYRISGNRGLTIDYRIILADSLSGHYEVPMEGKFLPDGESIVRAKDGSLNSKIETTFEDEIVARWQRMNFTEAEKSWAKNWRIKAERKINSKIYTDKINEAGLKFKIPRDDKELVEIVDLLLQDKVFQSKILVLLAKEHNIPLDAQKAILDRWRKEGKPMIKDFAPYAFFCARANFLWAIGLTNTDLFRSGKKYRKNDRKDLEYCYYLPHCEIFASKDDIHKMLVPHLLRPDQSFVEAEKLKSNLRELSKNWNKLSQQEQITYHSERGFAPPENENSVVFNLWKKHRNKISKPIFLDFSQLAVDTSKPEDEQIEMPLGELLRLKFGQRNNAETLSDEEIDEMRKNSQDVSGLSRIRNSLIGKDRLLKKLPNLKLSDLDKKP